VDFPLDIALLIGFDLQAFEERLPQSFFTHLLKRL
jgi:hypothetical protein